MDKYDFSGWATKYNVACSDGRTISNNAFKHCDGIQVPMVWNHNYDGPESVIGKAILKHSDQGVYTYCEFNDTPTAQTAKNLVVHGDITALSIYANKLKQQGGRVLHGDIREVSLVLSGANPGASIQEVLVHGDYDETAATIYNDEEGLELYHSDQNDDNNVADDLSHKDEEPPTNVSVAEVYNSMTDEQKAVVAIVAEQMLLENENDEGENTMKHNVFEGQGTDKELSHSEMRNAVIRDIKKHGTLKDSFLAHAADYGITNIGELFPDPTNTTTEPTFISRDQSWVQAFFNATKKSPFSRLKAIYADITEDEARAKGYITGSKKKDEVFSLLKRTTSPQTIYKKQKLDRDQIVDITDFQVVDWMKAEMKMMLMEELTRAFLIGDGRSSASDDKIKEANVRPIYNDDDLFTIKALMGTPGSMGRAHEFIRTVKAALSKYEGTGTPNLYVESTILSEMLLIEDKNGRFIYPTKDVLATTLGVNEIIKVPVMNGLTRKVSDSVSRNVLGIIVNPNDYTVGADKGGNMSMFDDFDIDYNQYKYLIETRLSGSLLKPKTAICIEAAQ